MRALPLAVARGYEGQEDMAARIGVISDTHIMAAGGHVMPAAIMTAFAGVDLIIAAGDLTSRRALDDVAALAPVYAVRGNMDEPQLASRLPERQVVHLDGVSIGVTHGHLGTERSTLARARSMFTDTAVQAIVFGHSHEPFNEVQDEVLLFNPGSATERRRQPRPSYGFLIVENGTVRGELVFL